MLLVVGTALTALVSCAPGPRRADDRPRAANSAPAGADLLARVTDYTARFGEDTGYRRPSRQDRAKIAGGVALLLDGNRRQAERTLSDVDFRVRTITERTTGRRYAEVSDATDDGPRPRGWGRVYVGLDGPARWSVQIPHPVADRATERLGVGVLRGSSGGVLVIAGAHRKAGDGDAADVAHRRDTVCDAVCAELARRGLPGLQVHGFADGSAPRYDAIASTGRGRVALGDGRALADALRAHDFAVCRAWARSCPLEGHTNVQGSRAAAEDVPFLHVEFSNRLRTDDRRAARAVDAMGRITTLWQKGRR
ncbi:hypothetical protein [Streptomyces sp. NPDC048638]|uniref:hypothetical protein n=1 Tax=Streptomyces sp. NPDC048638 TaxID=3365580 RepID=UPI0037245F43